MTTSRTRKRFDTIAYKRQVQDDIYEETKAFNAEETVAYFREQAQTGPLGAWWRQQLARRTKPA